MIGTESGTHLPVASTSGTRWATIRRWPGPTTPAACSRPSGCGSGSPSHDYFAGDFMWTGVDYLGESTWPFKGFGSGALDITGRAQGCVLPVPEPLDRPAGAAPLSPLELARPGGAGDPGAGLHQLQQRGAVPQRPLAGREAAWSSRRRAPRAAGIPTPCRWCSATTNDLHLRWDVPYEPGVLRAVGKRARTAPWPAKTRSVPRGGGRDPPACGAGHASPPALATSRWFDSTWSMPRGRWCRTADDPVLSPRDRRDASCGLDNGDLQDHEPYRTDCRRAFNGRGVAYHTGGYTRAARHGHRGGAPR